MLISKYCFLSVGLLGTHDLLSESVDLITSSVTLKIAVCHQRFPLLDSQS